jgi:hypothetical protein
MLKEIGYVNTTVYSNSDIVILPNRHMYSKFIKTVVMKPYLGYLAPEEKMNLSEFFFISKKDYFLLIRPGMEGQVMPPRPGWKHEYRPR